MKTRRIFISKLGGLAALAAFSSTARTATSAIGIEKEVKASELEGNFVHMVFFWLENNDPQTRNRFLSELRFIDNIEAIRAKHIGSPADTDRDVVDSSFSFSLVLTFDSKEEQDIYQEHKLHLAFIERASSLWNRVLVYDSVKFE